jgi:CheY-like chemotaxis protein
MARILIIDDESNLRAMLRMALSHSGHLVDVASDAFEGLERFGPDGAGWDLVLLDQRMPGMDGIEAMREIRRRRPDTRIILITAFGTVDLAMEAMRAGARDFLRKPFTLETLRGAVEAALRDASPPTDGSRDASPTPLSFDMTTFNGYRIVSVPGLRRERDGAISDAFDVRDPLGGHQRCQVYLPPYLVELVKAHADRDRLPGGDLFWQALCGEALANYVWQHADGPPGDTLTVEDLTSGLSHWIDAVLQANMAAETAGARGG